MKKVYIQPQMEVIKMAMTQMICTSAPLDPNNSFTNEDDFGAPEFNEDLINISFLIGE